MPRDPNIVRMTISLDKDLKLRMDEINAEKWVVNWSAVAARAFQQEIRKRQKPKLEGVGMEAVVNRLKASRDEYLGNSYEFGKSTGADWARNAADWIELKRLDDFRDAVGSENWPNVFAGGGHALARVVLGKPDEGAADTKAFWEQIGIEEQDQIASQDFARGFADGAVEVWEQVQGQIG